MIVVCDWDAFAVNLFLVQIAEQRYVEVVDVFLVILFQCGDSRVLWYV